MTSPSEAKLEVLADPEALARRVADWMLAAGFTAQEFLGGFEACKLAVEQKQRVRYSRGPNHYSVTAASVFIRFLQYQGELPLPAAPPSASDLWPLLGEFRSWMRKHRGLTDTTLDVYDGILAGLLDALGDDVRDYSAEALRAFVLDRARPHGDLSGQEHCRSGPLLRPLPRRYWAMLCGHGTRHPRFCLVAADVSPPVSTP